MLNFVVALPCEAQPLIRRFRLHGSNKYGSFHIYASDNYRLIQTGIGKLNAAIATTYLANIDQDSHCAWLNIGIAGSAEFSLGSAVLANKICDQGSGQHWYPGFIFPPITSSSELITVDQAQTQYADNSMYDMEASGFYNAANRFAPVEFVHCLKIISDNPASPAHHITEKKANELIESNLDQCVDLAEQLQHKLNDWQLINDIPREYEKMLSRWHFSVYQQNQLKQLLKRWQTLNGHNAVLSTDILRCQNAKQVLVQLNHILQKNSVII